MTQPEKASLVRNAPQASPVPLFSRFGRSCSAFKPDLPGPARREGARRPPGKRRARRALRAESNMATPTAPHAAARPPAGPADPGAPPAPPAAPRGRPGRGTMGAPGRAPAPLPCSREALPALPSGRLPPLSAGWRLPLPSPAPAPACVRCPPASPRHPRRSARRPAGRPPPPRPGELRLEKETAAAGG